MICLQNHGLDPNAVNTEKLLERFRAAMAAGLAGRGTLPMIPSTFAMPTHTPKNCEIPVFDVGGTNVRSARIRFDADGNATLVNPLRGHMPGTRGEVTAEAFYEQLCSVLLPNIRPGETLGYCFSYPVDPNGILLFWTKHVEAPGIVGTNVCTALAEALAARGCPGVTVRVLNDTVATLLASRTLPETVPVVAHVGFILGTGTNCAYAERAEAIVKDPAQPRGKLIPINCESGNFTDVPLTDFDNRYAASSTVTVRDVWERCISGVHLGYLGTEILRTAADEGHFSAALADRIAATPLFDNIALDTFCAGTAPDAIPCTDLEALCIRRLLTPMYERAARFAAVNLAAAALAAADAVGAKSGRIRLNIDGSTFWKTATVPFVWLVRQDLDALLGSRGYTYEIVQVPDAPLFGAALACC